VPSEQLVILQYYEWYRGLMGLDTEGDV
jgi:hypothetical protein